MEKTAHTFPITIYCQYLALSLLAVFAFTLPFLFPDQQFLTGTLVNAGLFLAAGFFPIRLLWPVIFFPSLAVLSRGLIFGSLTDYLVYFLPFIWSGNFILALVFKQLSFRLNQGLAIAAACLAKFFCLWLAAQLFFRMNLVSRLFLQTMGLNQLITAGAGGVLAFLVLNKVNHGKSNTGS